MLFSVSQIKPILSIFYAIYGALCFECTSFSFGDYENIILNRIVIINSENTNYHKAIEKGYVTKQWYALWYVLLCDTQRLIYFCKDS